MLSKLYALFIMKFFSRLATVLSAIALGSSLLILTPEGVKAQSAPLRTSLGSRADYGVVYYIPGEDVSDEATLQQLQAIKDQGYRHINLSSWVWTLPKAGSPLRRRVDLILDWCDHNGMGVWLLHNMQYGTPEYGDFEQAVKDPVAYARPVVLDWIDALRGHSCVEGVELGNEVGPAIPTDATKVPLYTQAFGSWLERRYSSVGVLNRTWGSHFASFGEVGLPTDGTSGRIDLQRFAREQFGRFYGAIFRDLFKPVLGAKIGYTTKTSPDPYLYRAFPEATVLGWDDLLANHPLWTLRVLADCDARPPFNNEIHLYHDNYAYFPSVELTRYRYFSDALSGQWMNSSFAWGSWNKPEIAVIHAKTSRVLGNMSRLEPVLRRFDAARRNARLGVLVTEPLLEESGRNVTERPVLKAGEAAPTTTGKITTRGGVPLEEAYTSLAVTGRPWRYVLDLDLATQGQRLDTLIVPSHRQITVTTLQQLLMLPRSVRIEWAGTWPVETEYGQPLPQDLLNKLKGRCRQHPDLAQATKSSIDSKLSSFYREPVVVPYMWWSPQKGHFSFGVSYPRIEARQVVEDKNSAWVVLINHTREAVTLPGKTTLPWYSSKRQVVDVTGQPAMEMAPGKAIILAPLDVRVYHYPKQ